MSSKRTSLKIFNATSSNKRSKGRHKKRWKYCVDEGLPILKVKNWKLNCLGEGQNGNKNSEEGSGPRRADDDEN
ncbi:hypothetical protein TNCV_3275181 [Trichonephila clavipes]|nr:hypothetical protein TNCV_3275181 [Trichonephila clavipes]